MSIADHGINVVEKYLKKEYKGAEIENVAHRRDSKKPKGCDLVVSHKGKTIKIEVKATRKEFSIPDAFETEFKKGKFVADYLYLVTQVDAKPKIYKIEKRLIDKHSKKHREVTHMKFASALKTELKNNPKKYRVR